MAVKVTVGDASWFVEDLTLDEACEVEKETGESWLRLNPVKSAVQARAIIVRFLARDLGDKVAREQVGGMSLADVVAALEIVDDDRPKEFHEGSPVVDPKEDGAGRSMT